MERSSGKGSARGCCSGQLIPIRREGAVERLSVHYWMGAPAEVFVHRGDQVAASQVLATFPRPKDRHVMDVAWALGLPPSDVSQVMTKTPGDAVAQGEVIAAVTGGPLSFFHKPCRATVSGILSKVVDGWAVIDLGQTEDTQAVKAMLPGRVVSAGDSGGSVIVETEAFVFDVAWAVEGDVAGPLRVVRRAGIQALTPENIPADGQDAILVIDGVASRESIFRAAEVGVAAVVVGSVDAMMLDTVEQRNLPALVLLEGYGETPISPETFSLLAALDGAFAAITSRVGCVAANRSVLAVSVDGHDTRVESERPDGANSLDLVGGVGPGDHVRAVRLPMAGVGGVVESIPSQPIKTHSGYELDGALVKCEADTSGEAGSVDRMRVPWLNLERIVRGGLVN